MKRLIIALLFLGTTPAMAADRVYSFPTIQVIRGFDTTDFPQNIVMTGGPAPRATIPMGPVTQGTSVRVHGTVISTSGTLSFAAGGNVEFTVSASGSFDETFVLDADDDKLLILGNSYNTATIGSIYIEVL